MNHKFNTWRSNKAQIRQFHNQTKQQLHSNESKTNWMNKIYSKFEHIMKSRKNRKKRKNNEWIVEFTQQWGGNHSRIAVDADQYEQPIQTSMIHKNMNRKADMYPNLSD